MNYTPKDQIKQAPTRPSPNKTETIIYTPSEDRSLEAIQKRYSIFPRNLIAQETRVHKMVRDPKTNELASDPRGRFQQSRLDVIDADAKHLGPLSHWHQFPDHELYHPDHLKFAEAYINIKPDIDALIEQIKTLTEKLGEK